MAKFKYQDYADNSKELFKMLFGNEMYEKLNSIPLKTIDWEGVDIETHAILATCPNIKERFSEEWITYFKDRNYTLLDLYIESVFHYGFQQCKN